MKKKKLLTALLAVVMTVQLTACGEDNTCKESECGREIYREGYCEDHFYLHEAEELTEGMGF